jgi:hypothetical protein
MRQEAVTGGGRERLGLLVVGMHRSGTSAATRIISLLGPRLSSNLMPASEEFNAAGFWESLDVVALNEKLLAAALSAWDDVLPVDAASLPPGALASFHDEAGRILRTDFGASDWFVLKDPRIGRLLAPWLDAVRGAGAKPLVVIPVRHPAEVAASLQRREGFSEDKSYYLWVRHLVDVLRRSRAEARGLVIYDELMADWRAAMQRLARDLAIRWPRPFEDMAAEADAFIDPGLRHHQLHAAAPRSLPGRLALELYDALCKRSPGLDALADSIDRQFAPAEALFSPLQRDAVRRVAAAHAARERQQDELRETLRRVEFLAGEVADLKDERAHAAAVLADYEATVRQERLVHAQLAAEFEAKKRHVAVLEQEREDLARQRDRGLARIRELEATVDTERDHYAKLSASFEEKEQHLLAVLGQLRERDETVAAERAHYAELSASFEEKGQHLLAVLGQLQEREEAIAAERANQAKLTASLQELEARVTELGGALEQARVAIARIDMALS